MISTFVCQYPECRKTLSSKSNLTRHVRSCHLKIKRFRCDICFKWLSSSQNLKKHMFLHNNMKNEAIMPGTVALSRDIEVPKLTELLQFTTDPDLRPLLKVEKIFLCTEHILNT